jgi:hypothetical protein
MSAVEAGSIAIPDGQTGTGRAARVDNAAPRDLKDILVVSYAKSRDT